MKRKQILYSVTLAVAVLFSILFQSFHSYEHLEIQLGYKYCHHKHTNNKNELTHQHKVFEQCEVCHFAFSSFIQTRITHYHFFVDSQSIPFFSKETQDIISFPGSLYAHRGPPVSIV